MKMCYLCAIIPPEGGEGELKKYHSECSVRFGWHSPLPLMVPLFLFKEPFPRDRVDPQGLKSCPPLSLYGPAVKAGHKILALEDPEAYKPDLLFREIHGKTIPSLEDESFLNWKGVLLNPSELNRGGGGNFIEDQKRFNFRTWQLALYRLKYDGNRTWWQDFSLSLHWKVRKTS